MERFEPSTKFVELLVGLPYFNSTSLDPVDLCKEGNCGPGEFQDKHGVCHPCRPGTTLDLRFRNHGCNSCFTCSKPRSDQIVIEECSATNDTVIGCPRGTFQKGPSYDFHCDPCRTCLHGEIEIFPCQGAKNTVCGPQTSLAPPVLTTADATGSKEENEAEREANKDNDVDEYSADTDHKVLNVVAYIWLFILVVLGLALFVGFLLRFSDHKFKFRLPGLFPTFFSIHNVNNKPSVESSMPLVIEESWL